MMVENVKAFLKELGLNWKGSIITHREKDFRPATEEDFKFLGNADYLIDFGKDGEIAISIEIDEITFKIYGESFDLAYTCYAGDNEKNLKLIRKLEDKDFSNEWIKFQLKKSGLVYAAALRLKCLEKKQKINEESERKQKQYRRKIEYLNRCIEKNENARIRECNEIEKIIRMSDDF